MDVDKHGFSRTTPHILSRETCITNDRVLNREAAKLGEAAVRMTKITTDRTLAFNSAAAGERPIRAISDIRVQKRGAGRQGLGGMSFAIFRGGRPQLHQAPLIRVRLYPSVVTHPCCDHFTATLRAISTA